jgi:hypothetical protein
MEASEKQPSKKSNWKNGLGMILSGIGLGWIIGMSTSPVIRDVILSFVAVFTTILGLIGGFSTNNSVSKEGFSFQNATGELTSDGENKSETNVIISKPKMSMLDYLQNVNLLPIGLFMIFLATGAAAGLFTKNNHFFATDYKWLASRFEIDNETFNKDYKKFLFESQIGMVAIDSLGESVDTTEVIEDIKPDDKDENVNQSIVNKLALYDKKLARLSIDVKKIKFLNFGKGTGVGLGTGLTNDKVTKNECESIKTYSNERLKSWLLTHYSGKKDTLRIINIDENNRIELRKELSKICPD